MVFIEKCEKCNKLIASGFRNEFQQYFCSGMCYLDYCRKYGFEPHMDRLTYFDNTIKLNTPE